MVPCGADCYMHESAASNEAAAADRSSAPPPDAVDSADGTIANAAGQPWTPLETALFERAVWALKGPRSSCQLAALLGARTCREVHAMRLLQLAKTGRGMPFTVASRGGGRGYRNGHIGRRRKFVKSTVLPLAAAVHSSRGGTLPGGL